MARSKKKKDVLVIDAEYVAKYFLGHVARIKGPLKYWRKTFYYWLKTHYKAISDDEIQVYLVQSTSELFKEIEDSGERYEIEGDLKFNIVLLKVKAEVHIPEEVDPESDLENLESTFLSTANGVISFSGLETGKEFKLLPHRPTYWTLRSVPHEILFDGPKPNFEDFLLSILPDECDRLLVQEIFGYCLYPDNRFQKAFIFIGEGSNGKSVLLLLLRLILGDENVGSLPLDAINPTRTFTLAALVGMLVNISEDLNEIEKVAEGIFKMMVAGETIMVERKHKDPFAWRVKTKQVYSTNNFPRFSDKSEGVARRLVILPFNKKISETDQRKEFATKQFWEETGELPAILGWAIQGLQRLIRQGGFTTSINADYAKLAFRKETNPAAVFLEDFVIYDEKSELASSTVYNAYSDWAKSNGYRAFSASTFSKEMKRKFPNATLTENARAFNGTRTRIWTGIKILESFEEYKSLRIVSNSSEDDFQLS